MSSCGDGLYLGQKNSIISLPHGTMGEAHYHARAAGRLEDIAIVGYAFRLPQDVDDDSAFWDVLQKRRNLRTNWPASRINVDAFVNDKTRKVGVPVRYSGAFPTNSNVMTIVQWPGRTFH